MKKLIYIYILLASLPMFANVKGTVTDAEGEALIGVNVYWAGTTAGTSTDVSGEFTLPTVSKTNKLVFSSVSYSNDTIVVNNSTEPLQVVMNGSIELTELAVVQKAVATVKSRTAVFQTEKITGDELCKAACCNLSESFETNPSVDVSYSDAATGAKQIKMLGLSGSYVQMLTENIPNLRGISSAYGLGFIPGPWMESIQVSKGTASVINGYEAVTGQINVEYKKPQSSEIVAANIFASDAGRIEANANASAVLNENLSTGVLLHASDELRNNDHNGDDFYDTPNVRQYNFINRWYYKKGAYLSQIFLRALSEKRTGGQIAGDYKIGIDTERYEFFTKNGYVFDAEKGTSLGFILSGSFHDQNAKFGSESHSLKRYDGMQSNLYSNLIFQTSFGEMHKLSTGASFNMDRYNEFLSTEQDTTYLRNEYVTGIFGEYTFNLDDKFIVLAGLRADYNSHYGAFVTPRLHLKYNVSDYLHLRASAGKGYRSPNVLAENNYMLASNRQLVIANNLKMEQAWNYGLSVQSYIPMFGRELSLGGEWYYTDFKQQVVTDMDTDAHKVFFSNLSGKSYASSLQFEASMEVVKGLTATVAHRITDVKTTINGNLREKPLTNRSKSLITASYQTPLKKWQFDFTAQFNGGGRLPDPVSDMWNAEFKPYTVMNAQITKYFRTWSVYAGSENLTGFVQQNPIIDVTNPFGSNFDATMIWGPTHGRKFYVGFRWALDRD